MAFIILILLVLGVSLIYFTLVGFVACLLTMGLSILGVSVPFWGIFILIIGIHLLMGLLGIRSRG